METLDVPCLFHCLLPDHYREDDGQTGLFCSRFLTWRRRVRNATEIGARTLVGYTTPQSNSPIPSTLELLARASAVGIQTYWPCAEGVVAACSTSDPTALDSSRYFPIATTTLLATATVLVGHMAAGLAPGAALIPTYRGCLLLVESVVFCLTALPLPRRARPTSMRERLGGRHPRAPRSKAHRYWEA